MSNPNDVVSPGEYVLHYQIQQRLGAGGMGVVYKALDTKLRRHVALKFLPPNLGSDSSYRERLLREAMAASALDHPNMGAVYAIEDAGNGCPFIVMAYYDGETLRARLDRGPLPPAQAIDIAIQVARGLDKAHERGIIHRDIKPSNVIITHDGIVKIVDFGLALISGTGSLTKTGTTVGTAAYMSPEQAVHSAIDHRTDLWSLGVVLHEMLGGDLPFHGENAVGLLYAVVHQPPAPLVNLPPAFRAIVDRCLKKPVQERYPTARELINDLDRARVAMSVGLPTETVTIAKPVPSPRRKPLVVASVSICLLALAGLSWLALSRGHSTQGSASVNTSAGVPKSEAAPPAATSPPPKAEPFVPRTDPSPATPAQKTEPVPKPQPPASAAKLPPLRTPLSPAEYGGAFRGELRWSGTLADRESLTIQAGHVSTGSLNDDLPLVPITIEVTPSGIGVVEAPSATNHWDRVVLHNNSGGAATNITVHWKVRQ